MKACQDGLRNDKGLSAGGRVLLMCINLSSLVLTLFYSLLCSGKGITPFLPMVDNDISITGWSHLSELSDLHGVCLFLHCSNRKAAAHVFSQGWHHSLGVQQGARHQEKMGWVFLPHLLGPMLQYWWVNAACEPVLFFIRVSEKLMLFNSSLEYCSAFPVLSCTSCPPFPMPTMGMGP